MDLFAGFLAGVGGIAGVWAVMRFAMPAVAGFVGKVWDVAADLDEDRDRIIKNLREEVDDLYRRLKIEHDARLEAVSNFETYRASSETQIRQLLDRVAEQDSFIARYIRTNGEP